MSLKDSANPFSHVDSGAMKVLPGRGSVLLVLSPHTSPEAPTHPDGRQYWLFVHLLLQDLSLLTIGMELEVHVPHLVWMSAPVAANPPFRWTCLFLPAWSRAAYSFVSLDPLYSFVSYASASRTRSR